VPHRVIDLVPDVLAEIPYIGVSRERTGEWPERVRALAGGRRRIGLAWAGSPTFSNDRFRSMPFDTFAPLADLRDIAWFSLQKGPARAQLLAPHAAFEPHDLTDKLENFADTAALVAQLDLVITVDTAVAHLAGALGKDVWVLLPANHDWRWLQNRDDSPWYPGVRLFRQDTLGDWQPVMRRVRNALRELS
jgi:ADP-heptose:LPS heptosyltransferase